MHRFFPQVCVSLVIYASIDMLLGSSHDMLLLMASTRSWRHPDPIMSVMSFHQRVSTHQTIEEHVHISQLHLGLLRRRRRVPGALDSM
jgi:HD-like signal output (HDOD) protein